jgi:hypothetical protein
MSPTEPLDDIHRQSILATRAIRADFERLRAEAATWEPAPYPKYIPKPRISVSRSNNESFLDEIERPRPWWRTLR